MTRLTNPLQRIVEVGGVDVVVAIVPSTNGMPAHVCFREKGKRKPHWSLFIPTAPVRKRGAA